MQELKSRHLFTLSLDVAFSKLSDIGATSYGRRRIAPITGGRFLGDRLRGKILAGGSDWVLYRPDGAMTIDVRITLETDDGALIYMPYAGLFKAGDAQMRKFRSGELLAPEDYTLRMVPRFETGDERYLWLNDMNAIGIGEQTTTGPIYTVHELV